MSLIEHIEAASKGKKSNGKAGGGPKLSKRAFGELADAWGIPEDKRERAESSLRLFLEVARSESDDD